MVVLCTQPPSPALSGSPEAVAAELRQVQDAHNQAAQLGKRLVTIYAAVPDDASMAPARRRLQGVQADVGTCGQLCQVCCCASWYHLVTGLLKCELCRAPFSTGIMVCLNAVSQPALSVGAQKHVLSSLVSCGVAACRPR